MVALMKWSIQWFGVVFITYLCVYTVCNKFYPNDFSIHVTTNFKNMHRYNRYMKLLSLLFFGILIEINSLVLVGSIIITLEWLQWVCFPWNNKEINLETLY